MGRRKSNVIEDVIEIGARLPLWVTLLLAVTSYFVFHHFANSDVVTSSHPGDLGGVVSTQLIRTVSGFAQYIVPGLLGVGGLISIASRIRRTRLLNDVSGEDAKRRVEDLSWSEFEQLIHRLFEKKGYTVDGTGTGPDGGVDLRLKRGAERAIVQCKHWRARKVPVEVVREQLGIVTAESADSGFVVTSGDFTRAAQEFARLTAIELIDGKQLQGLLNRSTPDPSVPKASAPIGDNSIAAVVDPLCPRCNGPMAFRTARRGKYAGRKFWGCERYPQCRGIRAAD